MRSICIAGLLLAGTLGSLSAMPTYDSDLYTIQVKNKTIRNVLEEIESKSEYNFFYDNHRINTSMVVKGESSGKDIFSVLNNLFAGTNITYKVLDKTIILSLKEDGKSDSSQRSQQANKRISGVVSDVNGEPIIGANVVVKGTSKGTVTDLDGKFALDVPEKSTLEVSYIGYVTKDIPVANNRSFTVQLTEDTQKLGEVIVTALGIKRQEKALGYSVQKVSGEELSAVKGANVMTSLTGKIAGVIVNNSSELSEGPSLYLRGDAPLIVVDGVAYGNMSLSAISAEDIESLDVLKGATASALYGVRGKSGAIMVTTKKGGKEGTLEVNASNNTMFNAGFLKFPEVQSNYSTGNYGRMEYGSGYVWGEYMDGHETMQYNPITMQMEMAPLVSKGKNNVNNFIRPSLVTNTNVNISQTTKLGGFRVSGTQIHQNGQYENTKIDKYILNSSGHINWNKFKLDAGFMYKKEKSPNVPVTNYGTGNILYNMLIWGGTEYDIRDFKNYWKVKDQEQNWGFDAWYDNPYFLLHERINSSDNNLMNTNLTLNYDITPGLTAIFRSGYDLYINRYEGRMAISDRSAKDGYYGYSNSHGSSFNNDFIVNGSYKVLKDFGIDFTAGLSSYWWRSDEFNAGTRGGLSIPGFYSLNASKERPSVGKSMTRKALYSAYGKATLSYKSGLYVDITGRNDWSSTLPSSSRSYFYPSVAGSLIPTEFYNPFKGVLDFWKLRGSWTIAKKDLGVYERNTIFWIATDQWNGMSTASFPTSLRDPNIKPESETSFEIGTNLRFFNNRLSFDYSYYNRLRHNRLTSASVSEASGTYSVLKNSKEEHLQKGMEFTISGKPFVNKDFTWESTFNVSFWHWYYHKLDPTHSSKDPRIKEGGRMDLYFITDWERDPEGNIVHQAGLPQLNKFSSVLGNSDSKCILGFSNQFTYKNFSMNVSIDGKIGGYMYSWTEQALWHSGSHPDSDNQWRYDEVVNQQKNYVGNGVKVVSGSITYDPYGKILEDTRVFAPNDVEVSYQNYTMKYNPNPWDTNVKHNIRNATFIKLREIAFNYNLPENIAKKIGMKRVQVGVVGQNLLLWTKDLKFSDPDRGYENLNSPTPRLFGFNINLTL